MQSNIEQPTKVNVEGTFHVPFTKNHCQFPPADGTTERACYFCRLRQYRLIERRLVPHTAQGAMLHLLPPTAIAWTMV